MFTFFLINPFFETFSSFFDYFHPSDGRHLDSEHRTRHSHLHPSRSHHSTDGCQSCPGNFFCCCYFFSFSLFFIEISFVLPPPPQLLAFALRPHFVSDGKTETITDDLGASKEVPSLPAMSPASLALAQSLTQVCVDLPH